MYDLFHSLDPKGQRVVSANYNPWLGKLTPLDLQGVDYATETYDSVHATRPDLPIISSETSSAVSDRGVYKNDPKAGLVTGYDTEAPGWGQTAEGAWGGQGMSNGQGILTRDFISGGFTWTGWDYKGEPTPDGWPDINSHFGILDITGFPKDRFYWYQAWFKEYNSGEGMLHLFPHWSWETKGEPIDLWAFSNGAEVELFVNNKSLGRSPSNNYSHAVWPKVPFVPGEIRAVSYDDQNKTIATQVIETTTAPTAIRLSIKDEVGAPGIYAGCNDVALVQAEVVDSSGRMVPSASNSITLTYTGPAKYLGGGNGDPAEHTPDKSPVRPAFKGLLLGIFGSTTETGTIEVTATSPGLKPGSLKITAAAAQFTPSWWCPQNPNL